MNSGATIQILSYSLFFYLSLTENEVLSLREVCLGTFFTNSQILGAKGYCSVGQPMKCMGCGRSVRTMGGMRLQCLDVIKYFQFLILPYVVSNRNDGYEDFPSVTTLLEIICDTLWSDEQTTSGRTGIEVQNSSLTVPGNLAQECLLVCLTLLDCPRYEAGFARYVLLARLIFRKWMTELG